MSMNVDNAEPPTCAGLDKTVRNASQVRLARCYPSRPLEASCVNF